MIDRLGEDMSKIILSSENISNSTVIPNIFIDKYMPSANGSFVKVYLYLLRCLNHTNIDITISAIADHLEDTEKDILRALSYWEKVNLLTLERDGKNNVVGISFNSITQMQDYNSSNELAATYESSKVSLEETNYDTLAMNDNFDKGFIKPTYTQSQIEELTKNDQVSWMMHIIEMYLERPLKPMDTNLILYLYESLNFSVELIMYLYEYCVSKNKKNPNYIETVALSWAKEGIDTVEKAEASTALYNNNYNAVNKAFGLNRAPGNVEQQYINKWLNKYKLSIDIIVEACNRTILQTQKPDFKYADKILENWWKKGVSKLADIKKLDEEHKAAMSQKNTSGGTQRSAGTSSTNKFNAFPQRQYSDADYSSLEQKLLNLEYTGTKR